jgi:hypothetical protein
MRPVSIRCSWDIHKFTEVDDCNRVTCERCGERKRIRYAQIQAEEDRGRQLNRAKTKGQKRWT